MNVRATAAWVRRVVSRAAIDLAAGSTVDGVPLLTTAYSGLKAAIEAISTAIALPAGTTIGGSSLVTTAYAGLQAAIEALTDINLAVGTTYDGKTILATDGSAIDLPTGSTVGGVPIGEGSGVERLTFVVPVISSATAHYPVRVPITGTVSAAYVGAMAPGGSAPSGTLVAGLENVTAGGNTIFGEDLDGLTEFTMRTAALTNTSVTAGQMLTAYVATSGAAPAPGVTYIVEITP